MFALHCRQLAVSLLSIAAIPVLSQNPKPDSPEAAEPIQAYSIEFKIVNVQTLANGTTITRETKEVRARDSQGRALFLTTRTPPAAGIEITSANVENPVDNTKIIWNSHDKRASVVRLPAQDQRTGCWSTDSRRMSIHYDFDANRPVPTTVAGGGDGSAAFVIAGGQPVRTSKNEVTRERLGTTMIEGVAAKGERVTIVIPAGQDGNDTPITITHEYWKAPNLPFVLREVNDDPRTGKRTREVVSLTIGEPDLSLFRPPEGYEVVNEEMHQVACQQ